MKADEIRSDMADAKRMLHKGIDGMGDFCRTYVSCIGKYGGIARWHFANEFPCFGEREWKRFELVGNGKLRTEFLFRSDAFVAKLMRRSDCGTIQESIVHNTVSGSREVSRNVNKVCRAKFGTLWKVVGSGHGAHIRINRACNLGLVEIERMKRDLEIAIKGD